MMGAVTAKRSPELAKLAERFEWIRRNRLNPEGRRWSWRALSVAAGCSHGHLSGLLQGRQGPNLSPSKARGYAEAADVSLEWLLLGIGEPGHYEPPEEEEEEEPQSQDRLTLNKVVDIDDSDPDPTRAEAMLLVGHRYAPNVLAFVRHRKFDSGDTPKGVDYWLRELREAYRMDIEDESAMVAIALGHEDGDAVPKVTDEDLAKLKKGRKK